MNIFHLPPFKMLCAFLFACALSGCGLFREAAEQKEQDAGIQFEIDPIAYTTAIKVNGAKEVQSQLKDAMEKHSQLITLKDQL